MDSGMSAFEMTGVIDKHQRLQLDGVLPISGPRRVRVLVLCSDSDDLSESEWLYAASHNPAFADLNDPHEDIYTMADGKPFHDQV